MATVVLHPDGQKYPAGTTVKAYKKSGWANQVVAPSGAPEGAQDASATVASDGSVTFTGLESSTAYFLYAATPDRYSSFYTDASVFEVTVVALAESNSAVVNADLIQTAIDDVETAGGGIVELTAGEFDCARVELCDNLVLRGAGKDVTTLRIPADSAGARVHYNLLDARNIAGEYQPMRNVRIEDLTLLGNGTLADPSEDDGGVLLHSYLTYDCHFERIRCANSRNYGCHVGGSPANPHADRNGYSEGITYVECDFENNGITEYLAQRTTLLDGAITDASTTLTVDDTSTFRTAGYLNIGGESIYYSGKTATTFTGCRRGLRSGYPGATAAAAHADDATVSQGITTGDGIDIKASRAVKLERCTSNGNGDKGFDIRCVGAVYESCSAEDNQSYGFAAQAAPHQLDVHSTYVSCRATGGAHTLGGGMHANAVGYVPVTTFAADAAIGASTVTVADASKIRKGDNLWLGDVASAGSTLAADAALGDLAITVADVTPFQQGDTIRIDTGANKEVVTVSEIVGSTLTFSLPLVTSHASGVAVVPSSNQWARVTNVAGAVLTISPRISLAAITSGELVARAIRNNVTYENCVSDMSDAYNASCAVIGLNQTVLSSTVGSTYTAGDATLTVATGHGTRFAIGEKIYIGASPSREYATITNIAGDVLTLDVVLKNNHAIADLVRRQQPPQSLTASFEGGRYHDAPSGAGSNGIVQSQSKVVIRVLGSRVLRCAGIGIRINNESDVPCEIDGAHVTDCDTGIGASGIGYGENLAVVNCTALRNTTANIGTFDPSAVLTGNITDTSNALASAGTLTLPSDGDLFSVTGTTTITAIKPSRVGRRVTLTFISTAGMTSSSSLRLNGSFSGSSERSITLSYDGTNWIEIGRRPAGSFTQESVRRPTAHKRSTIDRTGADSAALAAGVFTDGVPYLVGLPCEDGDIISGFQFVSATAGTNTHFWMALLDPTRKVLAVTNDTTTAALATGANNSYTLTGPVTVATRGLHYAVMLWKGSVAPTVYGRTTRAKIQEYAPIFCGTTADAGLTVPGDLVVGSTMGAISVVGSIPYIGAT